MAISVTLSKAERGEQKYQSGNVQPGLQLEGTRHTRDGDKPWKRFIGDWNDKKAQDNFMASGAAVGDTITLDQFEGQYKIPYSFTKGAAPAPPPPPATAANAKTASAGGGKPTGYGSQFREPDELVMHDCLKDAISIFNMALSNGEAFKALVKKGTTMDNLQDQILLTADRLFNIVKSPDKGKALESSNKDVKGVGAPDLDEPPMPTELPPEVEA